MSREPGVFMLGCIFGTCFALIECESSYKSYGTVPMTAGIVSGGILTVAAYALLEKYYKK